MDTQNIAVSMLIPFRCDEPFGYPVAEFDDWLPTEEDEAIKSEDGAMSLRLYFDKECEYEGAVTACLPGQSPPPPPVGYVSKIKAIVSVEGVKAVLIDYIRSCGQGNKVRDEGLENEWLALAKAVYAFTISTLNRLVAYLRSMKAQYWLEEYAVDTDNVGGAFREFQTKLDTGDGKPLSWSYTPHVRASQDELREAHRVTRDDWKRVIEFVNLKEKTDFVMELLAAAEKFAERDERRVALTEAVTALEAEIAAFCKSPNTTKMFGAKIAERVGAESLGSLFERIGKTGVLGFVFPVIFTEEQLPQALLKECRDANLARNTVVHNKKREFKKDKIEKWLLSIRQMCDLLRSFRHVS